MAPFACGKWHIDFRGTCIGTTKLGPQFAEMYIEELLVVMKKISPYLDRTWFRIRSPKDCMCLHG